MTCTYIHTQTYIHTYTHRPRIIAHRQNINSIQVFAKKKNRAFPPPLIHKLMGWFAFFFYPCVPDKTKCMVKPQNYIFFLTSNFMKASGTFDYYWCVQI